MTTVVRVEEGFTNTGRFPYALAKLACGHAARVVLRDTRGVCGGCGATQTSPDGGAFVRCACGAFWTKQIDSPNPHRAADRLTTVGDEIECVECARTIEQIAWLRGLAPGLIHHARFDPRFSPGSYHLYRHDPASPSGFFLVGSVPATPEFDAVLNAIRVSPLSPMEHA